MASKREREISIDEIPQLSADELRQVLAARGLETTVRTPRMRPTTRGAPGRAQRRVGSDPYHSSIRFAGGPRAQGDREELAERLEAAFV